MSRFRRPRITLTQSFGLASVAALSTIVGLVAVGCSDSGRNGGGGGATVDGQGDRCDPTVDSTCAAPGGTCSADAECSTGLCTAGACADPSSTDCDGPDCMTNPDNFEDTFLVTDFDAPDEGDGTDESCVDLDVDFQRVTPTVVLLIDQSGSMNEDFDTSVVNGQVVDVDRWDTLVATLTDSQSSLVKKLEDSVRFGMSLYTSNGGFGGGATPRECPILETVGIGLGSFSQISRTLSRNRPQNDTPTAESVDAIVAQLSAFDEEGPKSIILATDGDPDTCEDPDSNGQDSSKALSVAAVERAFAAGVTTHVISVGDDATADHLQELAVAGRGGDASAQPYTALDTQALVNAFNDIIGSVRTCDFTLEGTVEAGDAARGTVILDGATLPFGDADGWEMPDEQTVRLLGAACEQALADATGISMTFPCDAIQIIPR